VRVCPADSHTRRVRVRVRAAVVLKRGRGRRVAETIDRACVLFLSRLPMHPHFPTLSVERLTRRTMKRELMSFDSFFLFAARTLLHSRLFVFFVPLLRSFVFSPLL
jgi:hypothetical protein